MCFGNNLRALRIKCGMTQEELGRCLDKSKNNISQYETGKREPDLATLIKMAQQFQVTVDQLLGGPEPVRAVPVYDQDTLLVRAWPRYERLLPRGEAADGEYLYYYMGDSSMEGLRIARDDLLLVKLEDQPSDHAIGLFVVEGRPCVRMLHIQPDGMLLMLSGDLNCVLLKREQVQVVGTVTRVEFTPTADTGSDRAGTGQPRPGIYQRGD